MNKGTKGRVSELLSKASRLFPSSTSTASNPAVNASCSAAIPQVMINVVLRRAEGMLQDSTSAAQRGGGLAYKRGGDAHRLA